MYARAFVIVVLSVFFAGCMNKQTVSEPLVINDKMSCGAIDLKPNQNLIIHLESNPTTGYQWILEKQPHFLKTISADVYQQNSHPEGMAGVGGQTTWVFQAQTKGSDSLVLAYKRPWEKGQADKKFECIVNVN